MPTNMTEGELAQNLKTAQRVDEYDYHNPEDEDDYLVVVLYKAANGRQFRYIEQSGMNSAYDGAGNVGEWLTSGELKLWKKF